MERGAPEWGDFYRGSAHLGPSRREKYNWAFRNSLRSRAGARCRYRPRVLLLSARPGSCSISVESALSGYGARILPRVSTTERYESGTCSEDRTVLDTLVTQMLTVGDSMVS